VPKASMISIVDDDEVARLALQRLFRSLGYVSKVFASAEEFLGSPHVDETSCLITDVHMPGMNGVELQSHVKALGFDTPIIFVTAFPDERIRARALGAGAIGFLSKPFDERTLIKHIEMALAARND
jgi:FixJ family two-component response regulator